MFTASYGLDIWLEPASLPIATDLRALREAKQTVWVFTPDSGIWTSKFGCERDWRDTRIEHPCSLQPNAKAKEKAK